MNNLPMERLNDNPECNRAIYSEKEWKLIKEAIDAGREDVTDPEARLVLREYNLWDYEGNCPDEKQINLLYMRYS